MIASLRGTVALIAGDHAVIDVKGVGYLVQCHLRTLAALHEQRDQEVMLHIHTSVSADAIRLFGFTSRDELSLFQLLIGVERIGPKAALGILGRAELTTMVRAIRGGDAALVATVPGVGRKTAERVVLELRDKLDTYAMPGEAPPPPSSERAVGDAAVAGLVGLGFREGEARAAVAAVSSDADGDVAALVGRALRRLDAAGTR
ncbi:MAG: Holliday junction branch migration protein RuvA [Candidatus Dormibacteraeota bacterium]|nr:Holliday junction branch migration protein RuvA [Candidatus Dormibacteraeota bacterium]